MGSVEEPKQQRLRLPWIETPLIESTSLSKAAGCRIFLKLDNLQPSGSFKSRGIGNLVRGHASDPANKGKRLHFFIPSAGNAGLGAAFAASALKYPCTVAVPSNTKPVMIKKLQQAGARVVPHGANLDEAATRMREMMKELTENGTPGGTEVVAIELHPFDRQHIWEGVSTLSDELAYQLPPAEEGDQCTRKALPCDAIVLSVGGGGLMNGIIMGIERQAPMLEAAVSTTAANGTTTAATPTPTRDDNIHIIATETRGAHALAASVEKGALTSMTKITSAATSLGVLRVAEKTYENYVSPPKGIKVHSLVLSDADAARGVLHLAEEEKILVELACGVSVEAALGPHHQADTAPPPAKRVKLDADSVPATNGTSAANGVVNKTYLQQLIPNFGPQTRVVIVVCGGSNVSLDMASEWRQRLDAGWGSDDVGTIVLPPTPAPAPTAAST
ncbi:L-serine dehydratase [Arthroderma uncinatum]|uniref:L-serine dehydratase n=1 Tax=Arthroderma uncinatum TaxID=74035 RepID=UPI00144AA00F|nr:L-serine dehydratase [Arthroderma uncinatum]KAF3481621.1 L-serine dehydratase [Arthroderma uncinatum]